MHTPIFLADNKQSTTDACIQKQNYKVTAHNWYQCLTLE